MTGIPHLPRPRPIAVQLRLAPPNCLDCGETDRTKFYRHPTSKTGVQARCKRCDNAHRYARSICANGPAASTRIPRRELWALRDVAEAARAMVRGGVIFESDKKALRKALERLDATRKESDPHG